VLERKERELGQRLAERQIIVRVVVVHAVIVGRLAGGRRVVWPLEEKGMNIKALQGFCRGLPGATEDVKWGNDLVFSVGKKMFAAFDEEKGLPVGFKCSDEDFDALTRRPGIIPAPYAARFGWVSVQKSGALTQARAKGLIGASYRLVLAGLPRRVRETLNAGGGGAGTPRARAR
jgi:predicted DNA-binding protein (MmcQ/YjbR family)